MNAWELTKQMLTLEKEIDELMNKKKKSKDKWIDEEIDRNLTKMLEIKHKLEDINISII